MQKQAPSLGRILAAVGFALSCFGLMLFLWVSFGGPVPLRPDSYRITAYFPEATQLAVESDVRIGGVSVGRVKELELGPPSQRVNGKDTTAAVIEIKPEFAPISSDARAIVRQKTLLGESYVELAPGTGAAEPAPVSLGAYANVTDAEAQAVEPIPEDGELAIARTTEATQIDEIFNALDEETRAAAQRWLAGSATAVDGRGLDLNDALGNLGPFLGDASEITATVRAQRPAVRGVIRDAGLVFRALSEDDAALRGAVTGLDDSFGGFADANAALAESVRILPTFENEALLTLARLDDFEVHARPLVDELLPVAGDVSPTLRSLRRAAPHLRSLFEDLDPLLDAAEDGLPALRDFVAELRPALAALEPFLANLNPVVRFLTAYRERVATFIANPPSGVSSTLPPVPGQPAPRHYLRTLSYLSQESLAVHPFRLATNRGNGYITPNGYLESLVSDRIFPNFDCRNTDFSPQSQDPDEQQVPPFQAAPPDVNNGEPPGPDFAPCMIEDDLEPFGGKRFPLVPEDP
jgi:phospholipid/cholesterol/gamma-HCH transport system substrate-binding protein